MKAGKHTFYNLQFKNKTGGNAMRRRLSLMVVICVALSFLFVGRSRAADNKPLLAGEKAVHQELINAIPKDRIIDIFKLHEVWQKAMADPAYRKKIYLLDVRTHPEFYAFHIRGSDHVSMTHVYALPKKIKDPNSEIYVFCRTGHRATYVAGLLYKYGYKNVYCVTSTVKNGVKYYGGVVGWAQAGFPFVNQFCGEFKITKYHKLLNETGEYRLRMFHPY